MLSRANREGVAERRRGAVAGAVQRIRAIEASDGVNRPALERIRAVLLELTADRALFPPEDFPLAADGGFAVYRLSEDADHRFALYMATGRPGKETPPHDHTTWAVIVGVQGKEHNRFYARSDDRATPGRGTVAVLRQETVQHGSGVTLLPEDIHSIHLEGEPSTLMLHMYGLALDRLDGRVAYNTGDGTYAQFSATTDIVDAR